MWPISNSAGPSTVAAGQAQSNYLGAMGYLAPEQTSDDAGQAYADRLRAVLASGPASAPLNARTHRPSSLLEPKEEEVPGGPTREFIDISGKGFGKAGG